MCVRLAVTFFGLLAVSNAAPLDCEDIIKPLVLEEDHKSIMGKWIFIQGHTDGGTFATILRRVNSSWVEFVPTPLATTITLRQGNMIDGVCEFSSTNSTLANNIFYLHTEKNISTEGTFLPACAHCLTMNYTSLVNGASINSLYFFVRERQQVVTDMFSKQAECLGFQSKAPFSYDNANDFCNIKNGTSDSKPKEDVSGQ